MSECTTIPTWTITPAVVGTATRTGPAPVAGTYSAYMWIIQLTSESGSFVRSESGFLNDITF